MFSTSLLIEHRLEQIDVKIVSKGNMFELHEEVSTICKRQSEWTRQVEIRLNPYNSRQALAPKGAWERAVLVSAAKNRLRQAVQVLLLKNLTEAISRQVVSTQSLI